MIKKRCEENIMLKYVRAIIYHFSVSKPSKMSHLTFVYKDVVGKSLKNVKVMWIRFLARM